MKPGKAHSTWLKLQILLDPAKKLGKTQLNQLLLQMSADFEEKKQVKPGKNSVKTDYNYQYRQIHRKK